MKKALAAFLALLILCSAACADIPDEFIENWNKAAYIYGAPELSRDDMIRNGDVFGWMTDDWVFAVTDGTGEITEAHLAATTGDVLLPMSVMLGVTVVRKKSAETLHRYLGNILNMYLLVISDQSSRYSMFDIFEFDMEKVDGGFWFNMVKN